MARPRADPMMRGGRLPSATTVRLGVSLPVRLTALAGSMLAALAAAGSVAAVPDGGSSVRFRSAPHHVFPGQRATVTIGVRPASARCSLSVTYADGERQGGLRPVRARRGRATWEWRIPDGAAPGTARMRAACRRAGTATRTLAIVGAVIPARISVERSGFSIRPGSRSGSTISYGVILTNESPNQDAFDLTVLVNFVDDTNFLWGSKTSRISGIRAGGQYALGDSMSLEGDGTAPVTRLEVVVQIGGRAPASRRPAWLASVPSLKDVRIVPSSEPEWVGSVDGEIINDDPRLILDRTRFSTVILDVLGNIVGGGSGTSNISMPPGARSVFEIKSGLKAIPTVRAEMAMISVVPSYRQPGS